MAKCATVGEYIAALPPQLADVARQTCAAIDANLEGAESAIKWAHPTSSLRKKPVCSLNAASRHLTFGFWHGASIDDPSGPLETSGDVMAHAKLREPQDLDSKLFADWLAQAREIELAA